MLEQKAEDLTAIDTLRHQPERRQDAVAYCKEEIDFYEDTGRYNNTRWKILQTLTIVLGATATVLSGINSSSVVLLIARSATVAATTIAAGLNSSYSFQKESVRQWATADLLKGELIKFETFSIPYDNEREAVSKFVNQIRDIISAENRTWVSSTQPSTEQITK